MHNIIQINYYCMSLINEHKADNCNNFSIKQGWLEQAKQRVSPHFSPREKAEQVSLLVIHNISLPAGQFGTPYVTDLFMGTLDCDAHPSFSDLKHLTVSAHCLIRRDGSIIQYVSFNDKAWHAGVSSFQGREKCNDFSIGIELEGTDTQAYTDLQYQALTDLTVQLMVTYPAITLDNIAGHCDIAPGRKTDPGPAFDWSSYKQLVCDKKNNKEF